MQDQDFPQDSTDYTLYNIDSSYIDSLIRLGDYEYVHQIEGGKGFWESLQDFIFGWLRDQGIHLGVWMENFLIILGLLALIIGIIYFFSRYRSKQRTRLKGRLSPELHDSSEEWNADLVAHNLQLAKDNREWKKAVRWTYHLGLILLNDGGIIQRSEFKTAYEYQAEISDPKLKDYFAQLKSKHEKAWYDEVTIQEEELLKCEDSIRKIKQSLNETN